MSDRNRLWERRLAREGLGMNAGRDRRLSYVPPRSVEDLEEHWVHRSHGLVSSVYDMAASGEYIPPEEARRRNRVALKARTAEHGFYETRLRIKGAEIPDSLEQARTNLLALMEELEP